MVQKIKKGTSGLSDTMFSAQVGHLIEKMTGNSNFPTPTPAMDVIEEVKTAFDEAVAAVQAGDHTRERVLVKNKLHKDLEAMVGKLFNYVVNTGSTIEIQMTSGFPLAKERTPVGVLPMPANFNVRSITKQAAHITCKAVHGADSYLYQYTPSPSPEVDNWVSVVDTRCRIVIGGLQSGTQYKFRMCAVGAKGPGEWSNAVNCYIS